MIDQTVLKIANHLKTQPVLAQLDALLIHALERGVVSSIEIALQTKVLDKLLPELKGQKPWGSFTTTIGYAGRERFEQLLPWIASPVPDNGPPIKRNALFGYDESDFPKGWRLEEHKWVALLLACGANPNVQKENGNTLLHILAQSHSLFSSEQIKEVVSPIMKNLWCAGFDPHIKNSVHRTALRSLVFNQKFELLYELDRIEQELLDPKGFQEVSGGLKSPAKKASKALQNRCISQ